MNTNKDWPVLRSYDQDHLARIALPLGGIGTGTVSLGGRGDLRDWEIMNRPAKGFTPRFARGAGPFFALYASPAGGDSVTRALEGPLEACDCEGQSGSSAVNHGLPRFEKCEFAAAYPFGQVLLSDKAVPVDARIEAFNPLVPGDADSSGIPVAVLRFVLTNRTRRSVKVSVCGSMPNFIGMDGSETAPGRVGKNYPVGAKKNRNRFREGKGVRGVLMDSKGVDSSAPQWGTMALTTTAGSGISSRTAWRREVRWGESPLDFWDDFSDDGMLDPRRNTGEDSPIGSLSVSTTLGPRKSKRITFLLTWHFPNRITWTPRHGGKRDDRIGNYYTEQYRDAWHVAEAVAAGLERLESDTVRFVGSFCGSDLPRAVKEAALFNVSTLRTQTCFRTPDGRFYGWEGCCDCTGCCLGSCTHVWNYEQATAFLFGDLAMTMREVEFGHATGRDGMMSFRVHLPLKRAQEGRRAAADGQMGCVMKMYRDWHLSGDDAMLRRLWPKVRKSLEFCWLKGGWDADRDGVMEGCQHNTMDVEYYGPNPQMGIWYLGALRAAEEMAAYMGEDEFAATCRELFKRGSRWIDANLFNGEYYEHEIRPAKSKASILDSLIVSMGADDVRKPDYQLGPGCLVDQLVGQYMAHVCGLGYLVKRANVRKSLRSIWKYNRKTDFTGHFNNMRSYVVGKESALLMASYPNDRPKNPFPYFREVMTGFEYTAAVGMLYEGQTKNGLKCMEDVRDRYDGRKRSPFDEAECGHHYARAMASWAAVPALTGFHYSAVTGVMEFALAARPAEWFWSNGYAWGTFRQKKTRKGLTVELKVLHGGLRLAALRVAGAGETTLGRARILSAGQTLLSKVR